MEKFPSAEVNFFIDMRSYNENTLVFGKKNSTIKNNSNELMKNFLSPDDSFLNATSPS
jgi:hypothetical protein